MKANLLILSSSLLLLVSSSISSQPTDKINSASIILAKANTNAIGEDLRALSVQKNTSIKIDTEQTDTVYFSEEEVAHLRELFVQAEKAVKKNDDLNYFRLSEQLKDYPLRPYLQYQWLKKHLDKENQISQFLVQNEYSRYAKKLKYKWLFHLAKHKQWQLFLQHYKTSTNATLICYNHRAQYNTGNKEAALIAAKELWAVGRSQPGACDPLFTQLKKSDLFTQDLLWQRFDAALKNNKVSLAIYIKNMMPKSKHAAAQLWLNLHRRPSRHIQELLSQPVTAQSPLIFTHSIHRLSHKNITAAIRI